MVDSSSDIIALTYLEAMVEGMPAELRHHDSSGPHVHYEVHLGDHASATAVDPVAFTASVGAPLDQ